MITLSITVYSICTVVILLIWHYSQCMRLSCKFERKKDREKDTTNRESGKKCEQAEVD